MKVIAIGDTHGRSCFNRVIHTHTFDKLVFIGDYWDSFNIPFETQLETFKKIVELKRQYPDKVILLLGNHDLHYTSAAQEAGEWCSGFQGSKRMEILHLLQTHGALFQMAYLQGRYLFTHAGVTHTWLEYAKSRVDPALEHFPLDTMINEMYQVRPHLFFFRGVDAYGDDVTQSPVWVRPGSLGVDAYGDFIQVVGHTAIKRIEKEPVPFINGGSGIFIDALGTSKEYLVLENGQMQIGKLE